MRGTGRGEVEGRERKRRVRRGGWGLCEWRDGSGG